MRHDGYIFDPGEDKQLKRLAEECVDYVWEKLHSNYSDKNIPKPPLDPQGFMDFMIEYWDHQQVRELVYQQMEDFMMEDIVTQLESEEEAEDTESLPAPDPSDCPPGCTAPCVLEMMKGRKRALCTSSAHPELDGLEIGRGKRQRRMRFLRRKDRDPDMKEMDAARAAAWPGVIDKPPWYYNWQRALPQWA
jgi:hypothetical protein